MFLNQLRDDLKPLFLDLAVKAAESNGVVADEQKDMLQAFAAEMQIAPREIAESDLNDILRHIKETANNQEIRIIVFETIGILYSDSELDTDENVFLRNIVSLLGISEESLQDMISLLCEYGSIVQRIFNLILDN